MCQPGEDEQVAAFGSRIPTAVRLSLAAAQAGLVVLKMSPTRCGCEHFEFVLVCQDGSVWADGSGETAEEVLEHVRRYVARLDGVRREWAAEEADRARRSGRVLAAVREAVAAGRTLDRDWPAAATLVLSLLESSGQVLQDPDAVARVQEICGAFAGLWLPVGEVDRVWMGDDGDCGLGGE